MTPADLPPVTDAHRRAAFAAMRARNLSFEVAMQIDVWRRVIECAAHRLRTRQWQAQQAQRQTVRRYDPCTGAWRTQCIQAEGGLEPAGGLLSPLAPEGQA